MERLTTKLDKLANPSIIRTYLMFLKAWIESDNFYGCMFINACSKFAEKDSLPHQLAKKHKHSVKAYLQQHLGNDKVAEQLFLYDEGLIVHSQVQGQFTADNIEHFIKTLENSLD